MNTADIVIILLILTGAYLGYREGFLMELFSLLAILFGVLGGFKLMGWAIVMLDNEFDIDKEKLPYIAFAVVFIAIVIVVRLLGKLIKVSIDKTFLGKVDQIAGALLGLLKTAFILSVLLWLIDALKLTLPEKWTADSRLLPELVLLAPTLASWISEIFPVFKDVL